MLVEGEDLCIDSQMTRSKAFCEAFGTRMIHDWSNMENLAGVIVVYPHTSNLQCSGLFHLIQEP